MKISMRKVNVLTKKDLKDFLKNPSLFLSCLIPLFFVVLYGSIDFPMLGGGDRSMLLLNMGVLLSTTMCGSMITSTSISEEKEKFTLRTLMLSNISAGEFFLAKIIMGFAITTVSNLLIFLISRTALTQLPLFLLCSILGSSCMIMFSGVYGVMARDQMTCGVYQIPLMLLFLLPTMLGELNSVLAAIAKVTPLNAMLRLYYLGADGKLLSAAALGQVGVMAVWILISALLFSYVYKKKGIDN
ncbi:MAG: ABC transporter permease [Lachnospiraceae bacterium]|jgi:ABC-2 type transport system permease protein|nr:ABC transporter permease [Lachnospiraceae bacterium]